VLGGLVRLLRPGVETDVGRPRHPKIAAKVVPWGRASVAHCRVSCWHHIVNASPTDRALFFHINGWQRILGLAHQHLIKVTLIEPLVASIHAAEGRTILEQLLLVVEVVQAPARKTLHVADKSTAVHVLIGLVVLLMQLTLAASVLLVLAGKGLSVHHIG